MKALQSGKSKEKPAASVDVTALVGKAEEIKGGKLIVAEVPAADGEALRVAVEDLKGRLVSGVVLLASATEGKVAIVAGVTKDLIGSISAGDMVKAACGAIGGKGGGRPELAMGGGAGDVSAALTAGRGVVA